MEKLERGTGIFEKDYYYKDFKDYDDPDDALEARFWEDLNDCLRRYGWTVYDAGDVESQFRDLNFTSGDSFQEIVVEDLNGRRHILERITSFDSIGVTEVVKYVGLEVVVYHAER